MRALLFSFLLAFAASAAAQKAEIFSAGGAAIRGYDPVAYFTEGRPVQGRPEFTHPENCLRMERIETKLLPSSDSA